MKKVLVVGGTKGVGLAVVIELAHRQETEVVYVLGRSDFPKEYAHGKIIPFRFDVTEENYSFLSRFNDIDTLFISVGWGKLQLFKDMDESSITNLIEVNLLSVIRIIKLFYSKINSDDNFYCGVMGSIAGFVSSPFFSVYGATKAGIKSFIESVNVELTKAESPNRILNVSPGYIKGTSFEDRKTDVIQLASLAREIIDHLEKRDDLFIPQYEEVYATVLERYHQDFREEGLRSYDYKLKSGRILQ